MPGLLVGYDGSPPARRALDHAVRRASATKEELVVLHVLPPHVERSSLAAMMPVGLELPRPLAGTFLEHAQAALQDLLRDLAKQGVQAKGLVVLGEPAATVLAVADETRAAEIVIGHKSYQGPAFSLGPNADAILRGAKVPVTVVP